MEILDSLRFVRGAVSTKDLVPELKHLIIKNGRIQAFNGQLTITCPIPLDLECRPKAATLISAIAACQDVTALSLMDNDRLRVDSGPIRVFIDCISEEANPQYPTGQRVDIDGAALVRAFETLLPFIGNDASRPWVNGILLRGPSAFATNNVCLVEYWVGNHTPFVANIPMNAIKEVLRVKEPPVGVQVDENSLTFHYSEGRWIQTLLYSTEWPPVEKILEVPGAKLEPIAADLFVGLEILKPFIGREDLIYIREGALWTESVDCSGASYNLKDGAVDGVYRAGKLKLLDGIAKLADFSRYPNPIPFQGDRLRGVIMGLRT